MPNNVKIDSFVNIDLNMPQIVDKVTNDEFGEKLAREWARLIKPFVPSSQAKILQNVDVQIMPFAIRYGQPYAHYMYHGVVYVDPRFNAGGFTNDDGETWKSREKVRKVPSNPIRMFNYLKDPNKKATHHWDQAAAKAGKTEQLIREANKLLRRKA